MTCRLSLQLERARAYTLICYKRCCSSNLCVADQGTCSPHLLLKLTCRRQLLLPLLLPASYIQTSWSCVLQTTNCCYRISWNPQSCSSLLPHLYQVNFLLQFCNVRTCMHAKTKFSTPARLANIVLSPCIICKTALSKFYNPLSALDFVHFC